MRPPNFDPLRRVTSGRPCTIPFRRCQRRFRKGTDHMSLDTVVVTGASGQVGRALLSALQGKTKTIALVRKHVDLPASEVVSDWMQSASARQAISRAGSIVHLAGNLRPAHGDYEAANEATTKMLCSALPQGTAARIVFLSFVGASETASNAYLSTKARAERALHDAAAHVAVFRCTHVIGSPAHPGPTALSLLRGAAAKATVLGSGRQMVAPSFLAMWWRRSSPRSSALWTALSTCPARSRCPWTIWSGLSTATHRFRSGTFPRRSPVSYRSLFAISPPPLWT